MGQDHDEGDDVRRLRILTAVHAKAGEIRAELALLQLQPDAHRGQVARVVRLAGELHLAAMALAPPPGQPEPEPAPPGISPPVGRMEVRQAAPDLAPRGPRQPRSGMLRGILRRW